eukprot:Gb_25857 [translate_table: standard]
MESCSNLNSFGFSNFIHPKSMSALCNKLIASHGNKVAFKAIHPDSPKGGGYRYQGDFTWLRKVLTGALVSGDYDLPEKEDLGERRKRHEMQKSGRSQSPDDSYGGKMKDSEESEDEFYRQVKQQRATNLAAKAEIYTRKPTIPDKEEEIGGKRHITYQMEKNKGLTPHRKKLTKIPRKKYKGNLNSKVKTILTVYVQMKHQKAVTRRKGQVREVKAPQGPYGVSNIIKRPQGEQFTCSVLEPYFLEIQKKSNCCCGINPSEAKRVPKCGWVGVVVGASNGEQKNCAPMINFSN